VTVSEQELVQAYKSGGISQVKFFRALMKGGMSAGAAVAFALSLAPVTGAENICVTICGGGETPQLALNRAATTNILGNVTANVLTNNPSVTGNANVVTNTSAAAEHLVTVAEGLGGQTP